VFLGRDYNSTQKNFSTQIAFEIDTEVRKIIEEAHATARKIILEKKDDLILIAETLLKKETITSEEIERLMKSRTLEVVSETSPEEKPVKVKKVKKEPSDA
jgi:cell division protease FtsH